MSALGRQWTSKQKNGAGRPRFFAPRKPDHFAGAAADGVLVSGVTKSPAT